MAFFGIGGHSLMGVGPFDVCTHCGEATYSGDEASEHLPGCPMLDERKA